MFTILDYSSALEYSIIRRYTNIVYYYYKEWASFVSYFAFSTLAHTSRLILGSSI